MPFSFGNPWFLGGLLTVAVPIYLHLYYRKIPVPRDFPSLRLIRLSVDAVIRRMKLRNLILLLMRVLVLVLLCMALARPFLGSSDGVASKTGAPAAFVLILDNSMSMGASHQGISLFNSAKAKAIEILEQMGPYDKASIILMNDPGSTLFSQFTWDKNELKEAVRNVPLSMSGTNIFSALQPALKLLSQAKSYRRQIFMITDLTETAWKQFIDTYDLKRIDSSIDLVLIPVGEGSPPNMTVSDLSVTDPLILQGRSTVVRATVVNHGSRQQKTRVSLFIGDDKKQETAIEVDPKAKKTVDFVIKFPKEGLVNLSASILPDSLLHDNVRCLAARVLSQQKILIVKPPPDREGNVTREDLYLRFALNPMNRTEGSTFLVETRLGEEVGNFDLQGYTAVFLVNQRSLPDPFVTALSKYVMAGGNLVVFAGPRVDPNWYNSSLIDKLGGAYLLPARFFKRIGNAVSKSVSYQMTDMDIGHPSFRLFEKEGNGDPSRAQIYEFFQVQPNQNAMILAKMSHGLPGILEEKRGQGRVLLVNFTADTTWTNWPLKPTFLPFIHQTIIAMLGRQGLSVESLTPGSPISMTIPSEGLERISMTTPNGSVQDLPFKAENGSFVHFSTAQTDQTGIYRLKIETKGGVRSDAFAVNPPPDEGDLDRIPIKSIPRFIDLKHRPGSGETLGQKVSMVRDGRELGHVFLWLLLLLALTETFYANRAVERIGRAPA